MLIKGCDSLTIIESESEIPVGTVGELISPAFTAHLLLKVRCSLSPRAHGPVGTDC